MLRINVALVLFASVLGGSAGAQVADPLEQATPVATAVGPAGNVDPDTIVTLAHVPAPPATVRRATAPAGSEWMFRLPTLAGPAEDRERLRNLWGGAHLSMLRSASVLMPREPRGVALAPLSLKLLLPELRYYWNSDIPFTFNDGSVWAGRGGSMQATFGFSAAFGPAVLVVAPEIVHQQNENFQFFPLTRGIDDSRDERSSPWYGRRETIDLPSRMGPRSYGELTAGQSSFRIDLGQVAFGAASENLWWGPAIRNPLVMSSNAAGFPHLFLQTGSPLRTPAGSFEAQWILGRLRESQYFDEIGSNNLRALSGLAVSFRPRFDRGLTLGLTRVVYRVQSGGGFPFSAAFDVAKSVGRPNSAPGDDFLREAGADQIFSLFARWVFPAAGFETYGEWGRYEEPSSLRDLLTAPHHSQGYTLGLQWVSAPEDRNAVRVQAEATYLEPSASYRERRVISWYTSRPVPQGYTHLGQPIGAGIGPGASSQWAAIDYLFLDRSMLGLFANRIRWDNAAFYAAGVHSFVDHDVSILVGARARHAVRGFDLAAELYTGTRLNYLFQNEDRSFNDDRHVDIRNHSLRLTVTPRMRP